MEHVGCILSPSKSLIFLILIIPELNIYWTTKLLNTHIREKRNSIQSLYDKNKDMTNFDTYLTIQYVHSTVR